MSLFDAFQLVATRRRIWPNDGFCRHLLQLERKKKKINDVEEPATIENKLEHCTIDDQDTGVEILSTKPSV
jgi:hypothetical protein